MKLSLGEVERVEIRVMTVARNYKPSGVTSRAMIVYDAKVEEVWAVIEQAIRNACEEVNDDLQR